MATRRAMLGKTGEPANTMAGFFDSLFGQRELDCRVRREQSDYGIEVLLLEVRGSMPEGWPPIAYFATSVFDVDESEYHPVLATVDTLQERRTLAFHCESPPWELGRYIRDWAVAGVVPLDPLVCPYGGHRTLVLVLRLISLDPAVEVISGEVVGDESKVHWSAQKQISHYYDPRGGYIDWGREELQSYGHAVRLAVAVAAVDGRIDREEQHTIRQAVRRWGRKMEGLPGFTHGPSPESRLESALAAALQAARSRSLDYRKAIRELKQLGNDALLHQVLSLCYDVLAADGVADTRELQLIASVATELGLSADSVAAVRDKKILGLHMPQGQLSSPEAVLGIDPNWTPDRKRRYVRNEFMKWNGRLNALSDPAKRAHAQKMLDLIGKVYDQYR